MATVGAGSRNWDKLITKSEVDNATGNTRVYVKNVLNDWVQIAETYFVDDPNDPSGIPQKINKWKYTDNLFGQGLPILTNSYNKANGKNLSQNEINSLFFKNEIPKYNNDRAAVLNNNNNYANANEAEDQRSRFVLNTLVPGVKDPVGGSTVNSAGTGTIVGTPFPPAPILPLSSASRPTNPNGTVNANAQPIDLSAQTEGLTDLPAAKREDAIPSIVASKKYLQYPIEIPPLPYDFIKITAFEYKASSLYDQQGILQRNILTNPTSRLSNTLETVVLPMQPNFSESNSVDWGGDMLNLIQATAAQGAMGLMGAISNANLKEILNVAGRSLSAAQQMLKDSSLKEYAAAYFAGQAVGANITSRATGKVINPNLELLFSGPRLRTFNFNFNLTPRTEEESKEIRRIIKVFKKNMASQRSSSRLFLETPNIFKLEYIYSGNQQHPYLNKFKPCALTSFNVNYTPDGSYMTYQGGSLTSYDIQLSFAEIEPIYQDDFTDIDTSEDMGF